MATSEQQVTDRTRWRMPLGLRIFLLCAALVVAAIAAAVALTWVTGHRLALDAAGVALDKSAEAQTSQTQQRLRLLELSLLLLGGDGALVNYVAASIGADELGLGESSGPDVASLRDLLIERRDQFGFDLGLVLDAEGGVLARSDTTEAFAESLAADPLVKATREKLAPQSGFWREGDNLYQAAAMPLAQDGALVGFLLLAQRVDAALAADIARSSDAQVAFWLPREGGLALAATSLPEAGAAALQQAFAARPEVIEAVRLGQPIDGLALQFDGGEWRVRIRPTAVEGEAALGAVSALASPDAAMAVYRQMLDRLLLAGIAAVLIALPLSYWFSRRLLRDARSLADAAERAAGGDYQADVALDGKDELARLSRAVDSLLSDLREKRDIEQYVANFSRFLPDVERFARPEPGPASAPPQRRFACYLGAEFAPAPESVDATTRLAQATQLAEALAGTARQLGGQLLRGDGQRWVLGFEGALALENAMRAARELRDSMPRDGFRSPAMALIEGETDGGTAAARKQAWPVLVGIPMYQVERLLCESGAGRVLLTRDIGERLQTERGTGWLNIAHGALSNKRFFALNPEALTALDDAPPADPRATQVLPTPNEGQRAASGDLRPGTRFGGRYEILSLLGEGGMGVVYKAHDLDLHDVVALKMLRPGVLADHQHLERFKEEIRLARRITHPNVLRTFDFGESDGRVFISMEFVRGATLRALLNESGRLPYSAGLRIARQFCAGLAAAHEVGVIHRDIKPENVILEAGGNARLMDFGIARPARRVEPGQTQPGMFVGTPLYSAPEQLAGQEVDVRADIFSTGVMLSEMFCGGLPFGGNSTAEIYMQQMQHAPVPPSELWPEVPAALERIILRCLARDPDARYQSVAELGADLSQLRA